MTQNEPGKINTCGPGGKENQDLLILTRTCQAEGRNLGRSFRSRKNTRTPDSVAYQQPVGHRNALARHKKKKKIKISVAADDTELDHLTLLWYPKVDVAQRAETGEARRVRRENIGGSDRRRGREKKARARETSGTVDSRGRAEKSSQT